MVGGLGKAKMTETERNLLKAIAAILHAHIKDISGLRGRACDWQAASRISELFYEAFRPDNLFIEQCKKPDRIKL